MELIYHFEIRTRFYGLDNGKYSDLLVKVVDYKDYVYYCSRDFVSFREMKQAYRDLVKDVYLKVEPLFYENGLLMDFSDLNFYEIDKKMRHVIFSEREIKSYQCSKL